jgi:hypothetical protein
MLAKNPSMNECMNARETCLVPVPHRPQRHDQRGPGPAASVPTECRAAHCARAKLFMTKIPFKEQRKVIEREKICLRWQLIKMVGGGGGGVAETEQ